MKEYLKRYTTYYLMVLSLLITLFFLRKGMDAVYFSGAFFVAMVEFRYGEYKL